MGQLAEKAQALFGLGLLHLVHGESGMDNDIVPDFHFLGQQNAGNGQAGRPVAHGGLQHAVIRLFNDFRRDGKTHNESFR